MTKPKTITGYKMLRADGSSLRKEGRVQYTKKWQTVPGNGAYLAVSDGLASGGQGEICAEIEAVVSSEKEVSAPPGVRCFSRVRVKRWLAVPDDKARAAYEKATAPAQAAYYKALATAQAAYEKAKAKAWAAYDKATAPAWAAYEKAVAPVFRAMMATCKEIKGVARAR